MALEENTSFKLTWMVDDFSLWSCGKTIGVDWPWTPNLVIEALEDTEWMFELCPRSDNDAIAFYFTRKDHSEEDIVVEYKMRILRKECSPYSCFSGIIPFPSPGDVNVVNVILRNDLLEVMLDDQFTVMCDIKQGDSKATVDFNDDKWEDEMERLSKDMRKLFQTGYLSNMSLLTENNKEIRVHSTVLFARWQSLRNQFKYEKCFKRLRIEGISDLTLSHFVSFLYSGELPGSVVTQELFDFAGKNVPHIRKLFHTHSSDILMHTKQRREHVKFTWLADDVKVDSMPFIRVLPLQEVDLSDLEVELSVEEENECGVVYLAVTFSVRKAPVNCWITLKCTANLFIDEVRVLSSSMLHHFQSGGDWRFPNFIPMRLLTNIDGEGLGRRKVEFDLVISDEPQKSVVHSCLTEFHTGSRSIKRIELLASDLRDFFMRQINIRSDLTLRSDGGYFRSCRAVLSARSHKIRRFLEKYSENEITVTSMDSETLADILEYIYTGWTNLQTVENVFKIWHLARKLSLPGLVEKCQRFLLRNAGSPAHLSE